MKIIISDIFLRKTFDVYNIVKRHYSVSQIILTYGNVSMFSKFKSFLIYGGNINRLRKNTPNLFLQDLLAISAKYKNEDIVFLPIEEDTTEVFLSLSNTNSLPYNIKYLLPNYEVFQLSRNKYKLQEYCKNIGIPVPEKYSKKQALAKEPFKKLIVKPRSGSGSKGIQYINNKSEIKLLELFNEDEVIIQERLENSVNVIGAFLLCRKGEVLQSYCHKRIRTSPPSGGVTVYSKLIENKEVINTSQELLRSMNWDGLVMIEFLKDSSDNTYKIIEINPRIWGSILLSEFSGLQMLKSYIELSTNSEISISDLKINQDKEKYIRWVLPYDFKHFLTDTLRRKLNVKKTCFINFTYAKFFKSLFFLIFSILSIGNIKKLLSKIKK